MKRVRRATLVALLVVSGGAGVVWLTSPLPADERTAIAAPTPNRPAFAASMQGTYPDGQLTVQNDVLQPDAELLYLFDYYLSAHGEKTLAQIVQAIRAELRSRLKQAPKAIEQASLLLDRYMEYKKALLVLEQNESATLAAGQPASARLRAQLQRVHQIRRQYFTEGEVNALFALHEQRDADALSRLEIFEDRSLGLTQKHEKYAQLDAALPARLREDREAPLRIQNVEQQVAQMRSAGASEQEVYQFRALQFSADAAYRLQALDQEAQAWANRIEQYQVELRRVFQLRDAPLQLPDNLTPSQQAELQALRNRHFNAQEQRRLAAYERRSLD